MEKPTCVDHLCLTRNYSSIRQDRYCVAEQRYGNAEGVTSNTRKGVWGDHKRRKKDNRTGIIIIITIINKTKTKKSSE